MLKLFKKVFLAFLVLFFLFVCNKVQAMTIVLDSGHGASDPGAINGETTESYVTHKIGNYLKDYLEKYQNVKIIMTNTGEDEVILFDRAMIARKSNADLLVSLHINSSTSNAQGAEVYVTANTSLRKYNVATTELADKILKNLGDLGISNRGVKTKLIPKDTTDVYSDGTRADYMGIIRYAMRGTMIDWGKTTVMKDGKKVEVPASTSANVQKGEGIPAILVEHCFIQGNDYKFLDSDEDIKKLAEADGKAIVEQYDLKLKKIKIEDKNIKKDETAKTITIAPAKTVDDLNKYLGINNFSILDINGKETKNIATGGKIKIGKVEYVVIKMGDVTGDGKVKAADALAVLKHSMGIEILDGVNLKAAGVTNSDKIKASDALAILKYSMGLMEINL